MPAMSTPAVGIVGGLGPESTIDYYRRILATWQEREPLSSPRIVIDSLDVQTGLRLAQGDHAGLADYLRGSIELLARAGVHFVAMSANTAHLVFDDLAARAPVPLLSIVETAADEAKRLGMSRLALLGTRFTMEARFYPDVFARRGLTIVPPDPGERDWIHARYVGELLPGTFRADTRQGVIDIVHRIHRDHAVDGVILGGTELPLLLGESPIAGLRALDTTALHVAAIVGRLLALRA